MEFLVKFRGKIHVYLFTQQNSVIFHTLHPYVLTYSSGGANSCRPCCETEDVLTCNDLTDLTFELMTSKWVHGSPMLWASFLQIFSIEEVNFPKHLWGYYACEGL